MATKSRKINYPLCECPQASYMCCGGVGPAVKEVLRGGKKLKLCTKCDLSGDKTVRILPWVKNAPAKLLMNFDALGTFCLANEMGKKK